jgi:hypothetical protein
MIRVLSQHLLSGDKCTERLLSCKCRYIGVQYYPPADSTSFCLPRHRSFTKHILPLFISNSRHLHLLYLVSMQRSGSHQAVSPPPFHRVPSLMEQGNRSRPSAVEYPPSASPSTHGQVIVKEEPQGK